MNYRKVYMAIISHAKSENRQKLRKDNKNYIYYELHHILPRSLFSLWVDRKSNLILLTAREHFFCHQLLVKIYPSNKMNYALWRMANDKTFKISSRLYEKIRVLRKNTKMSESSKIKMSNKLKGRIMSKEAREKMSISRKGKKRPPFSEEWKRKISENNWTRSGVTEEYREKMRQVQLGRKVTWGDKISKGKTGIKFSEEHKKNISNGKKGQIPPNIGLRWFNNGIKNIYSNNCPIGYVPGMKPRTK